MGKNRFSKRLPSAQSLREHRALKPFSRHLHHHYLWQFNRHAVAGGVAVGLFFGIWVPFAQIFLAAIAAIFLRVNLPVAAVSTLVSNPLTFPPLYYLAYRIGDVLTGAEPVPAETVIEADIAEAVSVQQGDVGGWLAALIEWVQTVGLPLAAGLTLLALAAATTGYFAVHILWKMRIRQRWRRRRLRRVCMHGR